MNKALRWIFLTLLLMLAIAYSVLSMVFPNEVKSLTDNVITFLNTPVAIAGISTTIGGVVVFVITKYALSTTKFGRKELDKVKAENEEFKSIICEHEKSVDDAVKSMEKDCLETKENCENQVTIMLDEFKDLKNKTIEALKTIPNKKVQAIVAEYEEEFDIREKEIIERTVNTNTYVEEMRLYYEQLFREYLDRLNPADGVMPYEERENTQTEEE